MPTLHHNIIYAESDLEKAKMLNIYFSSQAVVDYTNKQLPSIPDTDHSFEYIVITTQDVSDVFQHLEITQACGPDSISPRFLKGCNIIAHLYSIISTALLNKDTSHHHGKILTLLRFTKRKTNHYLAITDLYVGRTMERYVHKHLYNYMVTNHLLKPLQSRDRDGDSTFNQLLHTYNAICEAVDKGKEIRAVFCDSIKAFD